MSTQCRTQWSFIAGKKGINRIRVYTRRDSNAIYVEWFDRLGRHQKVLRYEGRPVTDKALARTWAEVLARKQLEAREQRAKALANRRLQDIR